MAPLCFVVNPCICLDRKCVPCPAENAKGNLYRMECYANSILAKMIEILQMAIRNYVSFMLHTQTILKTEEMSAAHCGSFYDITVTQILMPSMCKAMW